MKINLFTSWYLDANPVRNTELEFCMRSNQLIGFDNLVFFIETENPEGKFEFIHPDVRIVKQFKRPTFNNFFEIMDDSQYENDINVLANSDIYFTNLQQIIHIFENLLNLKTCMALSRWDIQPDGSAKHFERADSQDTWIFYGRPKLRTQEDYTMGVAGCDNKLAYEIKMAGYDLINPSKTIKTYHYHISNVRNYIKPDGSVERRIQPPYFLVNPT